MSSINSSAYRHIDGNQFEVVDLSHETPRSAPDEAQVEDIPFPIDAQDEVHPGMAVPSTAAQL